MHFRAKQFFKMPDMLSVPRNLHLKKLRTRLWFARPKRINKTIPGTVLMLERAFR